MNPKQSAHFLALALFCCAGSAAGAFLSSFARPDVAPPASPTPSSAPDPLPAIAEVLARLESMREQMSASPSMRVTADPGAASGSTETADLLARLRTCVGALETQSAALTSSVSLAEIARTPSRRVSSLLPEASSEGDLPEGFDLRIRVKALTDEHLLWSLREVLTTYGQPKRIGGDPSGLVLVYELSETREIVFRLSGGVVTQVQIY